MAQSACSPRMKVGATHRWRERSHWEPLRAVLTLGMTGVPGCPPKAT